MAEHDDIKRYELLNVEAEDLNKRISVLQGQKKEKMQRLKAIFKKHGVANMQELEDKFSTLKKSLDKAATSAESFINEVGPLVSKIQNESNTEL